MIFHYFTKKWKWFYGRYAPSGIRVWRKSRKNDEFEKKNLYSEKIVVRIKKRFFTKGSTSRWIWHLYNVFRTAKLIQIQPKDIYIHIYIYIYTHIYISAIPYALSTGPAPGPAPRQVRGPRGRPSEGPGGRAARRGPLREGPAPGAGPAPAPAPPIGHRE